jgi:NitT/TauT family transport system ATP-binding protein
MAKPATGTAISLNEVTKQFRISRKQDLVALDGIELRIGPSEFVALLGPSGCGKSTLLRLIAGLEQPTAGRVLVHDAPPQRLIAEHRVGYAFQEHALLPWASVRDNIALPFKLARRPVDETRVDELTELVGLGQFRHARPKQLSGGMRQRVAIARALALAPDLLLLDEPFGALDEITRRRLNHELAHIWAETGVTTVLVTHSIDEALILADRIVVMATRPGRVLCDVPVTLERPRGDAVASSPAFAAQAGELMRLLDSPEHGAWPQREEALK